MNLVSVQKLEEGEVVGRSVFSDNGELLLAAGFRLNEEMINKLKEREHSYIYLLDTISDTIVPEQVIEATIRRAAAISVEEAAKKIRANQALNNLDPLFIKQRISTDPKLKNIIQLSSFREMAADLIESVISNNIRLFASIPVLTNSEKEYQHAVDTTLLCILIGNQLDMPWEELRILATASLTHDLGKIILLTNNSLKKGISDSEMEAMMREHPTISMHLIKSSDPDSYREQQTVHQHHERLDGKGYPAGLKAEDIPPTKRSTKEGTSIFRHSVILAVANHFDNLVSGAIDDVLLTPEEALSMIVNEAGIAWNSHAVKALCKVVQLYPVGSLVRVLKTQFEEYAGYYGVVTQIHDAAPLKPVLVMTKNSLGQDIEPVKVDTRRDKKIKLELVV